MATEREYLISLNLAKAGRGRYSKDASKALEEAKKGGMVFDLTPADIAKLERKNKPQRKTVVIAPKESRPSQDAYDAKAVRAWGESNGVIEKGRRGKLPTTLINSYLASNKPAISRRVAVKEPVKRDKVRKETTGWTRIKRRITDASYISEPLVAVSTCGGCSKGVAYCGCKAGPKAPKYLGGELLLLTRPAK